MFYIFQKGRFSNKGQNWAKITGVDYEIRQMFEYQSRLGRVRPLSKSTWTHYKPKTFQQNPDF